MDLDSWGWTPVDQFHLDELNEKAEIVLRPARVTKASRGHIWLEGVGFADVARVSIEASAMLPDAPKYPVVGDWTLTEAARPGVQTIVRGVLPRRTEIARKASGRRTEAQVLAANVDVALLVMGLDDDFNIRRLERYLALVRDAGVKPVVVLSKLDLCAHLDDAIASLEPVTGDAPIVALSGTLGDGVDALRSHLGVGTTAVLLGSSGAGKSTLSNRLLGREHARVAAVRASDGRGKHTTTGRELSVTEDGTLLIDTPGLRELQLWTEGDAIGESFADVDALTKKCRFSDCGHRDEPGCAINEAIQHGNMDAERFINFQKMQAEQAALDRRRDDAARRSHDRDLSKKIRNIGRAAWRRKQGLD